METDREPGVGQQEAVVTGVRDHLMVGRVDAHRGGGGAGLDVFEHEPAVNPRLLKAKKAVLLPHMGSATIEGRIDMGEKVIINIKTYMDGHRPPDRVIPAML